MPIKRSVLFVGDGGDLPRLKTLLNDRDIDLKAYVRHASIKMPPLLRHLRYFRLAAYAVFSRRRHDAVFIWQQFVGLYYFLISLLYPLHRRPCCVFYIIFKSKPSSLIGKVKRSLMIAMTRSLYVDKVIFMSKSDALYPEVSVEKRLLLGIYVAKSSYIESKLASVPVEPASDYFSGGTSNRDYASLKALAKRMADKTFRVACLPKDLDHISPVPHNMHVDCDAYGQAFEDMILSSKAVVLPLLDPNVTSGEIVCLRAMQCAKPVFITKNNFLVDRVPNVSALRFVVMYDTVDELSHLLASFSDDDLRELGLEARECFLSSFDEESFYRGIVDVIEAKLLGYSSVGEECTR